VALSLLTAVASGDPRCEHCVSLDPVRTAECYVPVSNQPDMLGLCIARVLNCTEATVLVESGDYTSAGLTVPPTMAQLTISGSTDAAVNGEFSSLTPFNTGPVMGGQF
jgi:hypothetical protein